MTATLDYALDYATRLGWPVLPIRRGTKKPLTEHGYQDATTDKATIRGWFQDEPKAGIAVATGSPGPQVGDVDDPAKAGEALKRLRKIGVPIAATARGLHFFFTGTDRHTVVLDYGELRGVGSYVILPPSRHPDGRFYTWLNSPYDCALVPVPEWIVPQDATTAGAGEQPIHVELVPYRQRHPYLADVAVRLARAGMTDERRLVVHLRAEFEAFCEPEPAPVRGYFEQMAKWASGSHIADRERALGDFAARWRGDMEVAP